MLARAAVIPWSPLLVPGAAGEAKVLGGARELVRAALVRVLDGAGPGEVVAVLAPGPGTRSGRMRPSLGSAGVLDTWVPAVEHWGAGPAPVAQLPASVALCCLAGVWGPERTGAVGPVTEVIVHEVAPTVAASDVVVAEVARAGRLVVVAQERPEVLEVLARVAATRGWSERDVREVVEHGPHLESVYRVTMLGPASTG